MALASVLGICLSMELGTQRTLPTDHRFTDRINRVLLYNPTLMLIAGVLKSVAHPRNSVFGRMTMDVAFFYGVLDDLSVVHKLWLSRVMVQMV